MDDGTKEWGWAFTYEFETHNFKSCHLVRLIILLTVFEMLS